MPTSGVGHAHLLEEVDGTLLDLVALDLVVRVHRLVDLIPHAQHRVQRAERVLEDHRDVAAADVAQLLPAHLEPHALAGVFRQAVAQDAFFIDVAGGV